MVGERRALWDACWNSSLELMNKSQHTHSLLKICLKKFIFFLEPFDGDVIEQHVAKNNKQQKDKKWGDDLSDERKQKANYLL